MSKIRMAWNARSSNSKTGPVISGYCGQSIADMVLTCIGCALRTLCYAWRGTPKIGFGAMCLAATGGKSSKSMKGTDAVKRGGRYSIENAIKNCHSRCNAARIGALGDCSGVMRSLYLRAVLLLRKANLVILNYTHFWWDPQNAELQWSAMGSCNSFREVPACIAAGFVPTAVYRGHHKSEENKPMSVTAPGGNELLVCLHNRCETQCNDCLLCDPMHRFWAKQSKYVGIALYED